MADHGQLTSLPAEKLSGTGFQGRVEEGALHQAGQGPRMRECVRGAFPRASCPVQHGREYRRGAWSPREAGTEDRVPEFRVFSLVLGPYFRFGCHKEVGVAGCREIEADWRI